MKYLDKIYGEIEINEPIILDLMNSPSVRRLKGIDQHGHFEIYFPYSSVSRFEHSVGVFILLEKFNAPLQNKSPDFCTMFRTQFFLMWQIMFFVTGPGAYQNFQDEELEGFIKNSEIPET